MIFGKPKCPWIGFVGQVGNHEETKETPNHCDDAVDDEKPSPC